jgi:enoyl-CoA hydratase/carnithine racemase
MTSTAELTHALVLAILAPDQERVDRAIKIAEEIAANLTPKQIASAKRAAIKLTK